MASSGGTDQRTPGQPMTMMQHMIDKGAEMMQSLKPIKQFSQHVCTFALYSHDMSRQVETHHFVHRLNEDFCQCAVYDTDDRGGRLIGVEYIISDRLFEALPPDEQKLWHSHAFEIKSGLWMNPRVPEAVVKTELDSLAKTYGKFWCTWQVDRGDLLPVGEPALMMSPQVEPPGLVKPALVQQRDQKYNISSERLSDLRVHIAGATFINPNADYWKKHGKAMASSDGTPGPMPSKEDGTTPGKEMTVGQHMLDKGALMLQSFKPINKFNYHLCTFALYSHDLSRQIQTHHFMSRLNQDFCQCAVYDSDAPSARLIGVEYIISDKTFQTLPPDEQKLWHSHGYEIKSGLLINPRLPEVMEKQELQILAKTYGKFWCTWQVDRGKNDIGSKPILTIWIIIASLIMGINEGDKLPLGAPALMVSPQSESTVSMEMVKKRDDKYEISSENLIASRSDFSTPDTLVSYADYWKQSGKGFAIDIHTTQMKTTAPFP
ncbi:hypothetical protein Cgig2_029379 [Carnegiea gigantea]|uniref:Oil body-associated protein 2B n=1 Tax=Carnegiea gigantea TaxID=171969 RepID=A0A9Q1KWS1_9CARY|nr:hypothetical protein Cgig2_029379 [Carnegiea gigantea]